MGYLEEILDQFIFLHGEDYDPEEFMLLIPDENSFLFHQTFPKGFDYESFDSIRNSFSLRHLDQASGIIFYRGYACQFYDRGIAPKFIPMPRFAKLRFVEFKRLNQGWLEKRFAQMDASIQWEFVEGLGFRDWISQPPEEKP